MKYIGSIPEVLKNPNNVYEGNLKTYFKIIFNQAKNLNNSYHNFRHLFHVLWNCYLAVVYYGNQLTLREARNLFISAMFHDFDHIGRAGKDDHNIALAIEGLEKHILPEDLPFLSDIKYLIQVTKYPYTIPLDQISLSGKILRDADMSQALSDAWIQQVVFGLAEEWDVEPHEVLRMQIPFLKNLVFVTTWAQELFPQSVIDAKKDEVEEYLGILEE